MSDEQPKPISLEERHQQTLKENREKDERMEKTRQQTIERLESDPAILKFFEQFNKYSIESFITSYANLKKLYMEYGDQFGEYAERQNISYLEEAKECLRIIQLKKLFDMRCLWGAYKADLPGMETSWDFLYWSDNVMNAPFLSPITNAEFELFLQFAPTGDFEYSHNYWLDFQGKRSGNTGDDEAVLPEWFYFHNTHTNASQYFALPDLRGEKEMFYRKLWMKERDAETERKYASGELKRPEPMDKRPYLSGYKFDEAEQFVKMFEDEAARKKFYGYTSYSDHLSRSTDENDNNDYLNERAEEIMGKICSLREKIPVEANADIRVAIMDAWDKYKRQQIIYSLRPAYEDYFFRIQNNISFPEGVNAEHSRELAKNTKEQVLRGRELNGEPADLNF
jgi:hypothetical protein